MFLQKIIYFYKRKIQPWFNFGRNKLIVCIKRNLNKKVLFLKRIIFFIVGEIKIILNKIIYLLFNFLNKDKKHILTIIIVFFCVAILTISVRGILGNPTEQTISNREWTANGPLENSNEKGRFALLYSIVENRSLFFSIPLARFSTPDLAINDKGEYVSLFAPGVSFLLIPGYLIGKYFGLSQVGVYAFVSIFSVFNFLLLRAIAIRLGVRFLAANIGAMAFIFASPAFAYAVTLSQHHISTFFILFSIYAIIRWNNYWSLAFVWFLSTLAISIDYPNFFMMLPIGIFALGRIISLNKENNNFKFKLNYLKLLTFSAMLIPIIFFVWYNINANGGPFRLTGTLTRVVAIDKDGNPTGSGIGNDTRPVKSLTDKKREKTAVGTFRTRNLLNGFYIHFISPDRGIVNFAPVMLIGFLGLFYFPVKKKNFRNMILSIIGANILIYSMFGDPWGGWSFGSRYLIPAYAMLSLGISAVIQKWKRNLIFLIIFIYLLVNSVGINSLGALTSSLNPPQTEVLELEQRTGVPQKYTYDRNKDFLAEKGSKSLIFQVFAKKYINAIQYYKIIKYSILFTILSLIFIFSFEIKDIYFLKNAYFYLKIFFRKNIKRI